MQNIQCPDHNAYKNSNKIDNRVESKITSSKLYPGSIDHLIIKDTIRCYRQCGYMTFCTYFCWL